MWHLLIAYGAYPHITHDMRVFLFSHRLIASVKKKDFIQTNAAQKRKPQLCTVAGYQILTDGSRVAT